MEKGINLSLAKSQADFDALLEKAIGEVSSKKLSVMYGHPDSAWELQVGGYIQVERDEGNAPIFWVGYEWKKGDEQKVVLWLEFDKKTCPAKDWGKLNGLVGSLGKYYGKVDSEFAEAFENTWVHFYLKEEYLERFYDEETDLNAQKDVLAGFIGEIVEKI